VEKRRIIVGKGGEIGNGGSKEVKGMNNERNQITNFICKQKTM
jgi:hypothetical protein